jgi:hypothetical protein
MDQIFEFFQNNKNTEFSELTIEVNNIQSIRNDFSNQLPIVFSSVAEVLANSDTKALIFYNNSYYLIHIDPFFELSLDSNISNNETLYCHFQKFKCNMRAIAFYQMV